MVVEKTRGEQVGNVSGQGCLAECAAHLNTPGKGSVQKEALKVEATEGPTEGM